MVAMVLLQVLFPVSWVAGMCLSVILGFDANQMTAKHYLREGWIFADPPDSDVVRLARQEWQLPEPTGSLGSTAPEQRR